MSFEKDEIDKKEFARHIGDAIKSRRVMKHITQQTLSELTNISIPHISAIERGEKIPGLVILIRISKVLKINMQDLFKDYLKDNNFIESDYQKFCDVGSLLNNKTLNDIIHIMEDIIDSKL